ncbi:MAG: DDE domain-containing protein, partial [Verrucomicrobiae bacterium]|nr:DDE domain-containing protein [Verrucomicrobiae bacterium]
QHQMIKYLNNTVEQDHRLIKRVLKPKLGLQNFETASALIPGIETIHILRKQQAGPMSPIEEMAFINRVMMAA